MHDDDNTSQNTTLKRSTLRDGEPKSLAEWYEKYSEYSYHQMDWELLKYLAAKEQKSYRQIAKEFNISRNTLSKYINESARPSRRPQPVRDQWRETVRKIWTYHSANADTSKLTAQWIFTLLAEKHGYRGSERTIRTLILELKDDQT